MPSPHNDQATIVQQLTEVKISDTEVVERLEELERQADEYRNDPLLQHANEQNPVRDRIVSVCRVLCASDDYLKMQLRDLVQQRGTEIAAVREHQMREIRWMIDQTIDSQALLITEQKRKLIESEEQNTALQKLQDSRVENEKSMQEEILRLTRLVTEARADRDLALLGTQLTIRKYEGFKRLILQHGLDIDVEIDIDDILDQFRKHVPILADEFNRYCQIWQSEIQLDAEPITGLEVFLLSIANPENLSLQTITGFVRSRPRPIHIVFIEEALKNVAKPQAYNTRQALFFLRGVQLVWMSRQRTGGSEKEEWLRNILEDTENEFPAAPLVLAYHDWLLDLVVGHKAVAIDHYVRQHASTIPYFQFAFDVVVYRDRDNGLIVVSHDGPPLIGPASLLRTKPDQNLEYLDVWVDGFPDTNEPMVLRMEINNENLALLQNSLQLHFRITYSGGKITHLEHLLELDEP